MDSNRWQVSTEGGQVPQWNKNGREIFYWGKSHMMVVPVATKRAFQHDEPEQMFAHHDYAFHATRNYDVSRDGERFLMVKPKDSDRIVVILNWFDELERLLPEG
jgi:hypothetical protein